MTVSAVWGRTRQGNHELATKLDRDQRQTATQGAEG
jgi:hypothetical protein